MDNHMVGYDGMHRGLNRGFQAISGRAYIFDFYFDILPDTVSRLLEIHGHKKIIASCMGQPFTGCFDPQRTIELYGSVPGASLYKQRIATDAGGHLQQRIDLRFLISVKHNYSASDIRV